MNLRQRVLASHVSAAVALGAAGLTPLAAQAQAALEEVVVTARKREETLQETPIAVSAFSGENLEELGLTNISDLTKVVPNVDMYSGNGTTGAGNVFIRGVGARNTGVNFDSGVGIYVDGVYVSRSDGAVLDNVDLQSVQVLRGPQGTLFGKNTTGGAILYNTNRPNEEFGGHAEARVGNYDTLDSQGTLNIPLIGDTLMSRFSLYQSKSDGYVKSRIPDNLPEQAAGNQPFLDGEEYNDTDRWGGQAQLRWVATDELLLDLNYTYAKTDQAARGQNCEVVEGIPGAGWQANLQDSTIVLPSTGLTIKDWCRENQNMGKDKIMANLGPNRYRAETNTLSLTSDWEFTDTMNVKAIAAWRNTEGGEINELDAIGIANLGRTNYGQTDTEERGTDAYSLELQVSGDAFDDRLSYVFGAYGFDEDTDKGSASSPTGQLFNALNTPTTAFFTNTLAGLFAKNTSVSFFSQGDWRFDDYWTLTAGLRYTWEERKLNRTNQVPDTATVATTGDAIELVPNTIWSFPSGPETFNYNHQWVFPDNPLSNQTMRVDDSKVTPMVSLQRTFDEWGFMNYGNAYATISNGFLSGGVTDTVNLDGEIEEFDPEEVWNYELGFKMDAWDRKLRLNTAVFYTDYQDRQLTTVRINPETGRISGALINAKESWIAGIEFEAVVLPVENLQLTANLTFNDSDIEEYDDERIFAVEPGSEIPDGCTRINVNGLADVDSCAIDRSDEDLPRLPDSVFFLAAQYTWETEWGQVVPMVSWSYRRNLDNCFDASSCQSGKYKVNQEDVSARLSWFSPDMAWRVTAWGRNLTDDRYISGGTPLVDVTETAGTVYNPPRTYGVEAAYTW